MDWRHYAKLAQEADAAPKSFRLENDSSATLRVRGLSQGGGYAFVTLADGSQVIWSISRSVERMLLQLADRREERGESNKAGFDIKVCREGKGLAMRYHIEEVK